MLGLPPEILTAIRELLEDYFDEAALSLLGLVFDEESQSLLFNDNLDSLTSLYLKALNTENPTKEESDVLQGLLGITNDYIESLKEGTKASVANELNAYAQSMNLKKEPIDAEFIEKIVEKQMEVAGNKFNIIASAQSNVTKNMGLLSAFTRMSESNGEEDTICFFRPVPVDSSTSQATFDVHLLPDQITPRLYYAKEINQNFYKKGDKIPSVFGTNPYCRCNFSYLARSYDFDEQGKIVYKEKGFNALEEQRLKFPLP